MKWAAPWLIALSATLLAQAPAHDAHNTGVALQPFAVLARRVVIALDGLGQPMNAGDRLALDRALSSSDEADGVAQAVKVLDRYALARVEINPEARVKVLPGEARPTLVEAGTSVFLVKVVNQAGLTAPLRVTSPQSKPVSVSSSAGNNTAEPSRTISDRDIAERWADISLVDKPPLGPALSGLGVEYRILEVYSRDPGERAAVLQFDVGQGTEDLGYRADLAVVFRATPARRITMRVEDDRGKPAIARLVIRDRSGRVYPAMSKRLAPDFPFQPQIYRADGESIVLPEGTYDLSWSGGPDFTTGHRTIEIGGDGPEEIPIALTRWIDTAALGWYAGDHHVHAAGCSHYQDPAQGVGPADIARQVRGEGLNVGSILTWGPCYYHQRQFFSGHDDRQSTDRTKIRYDLEISGFPSSHAGHLVLLGLKNQEYPGTSRLDDWPTWTVPILRWAKQQGATTGYAHSGWGLQIADRHIPSDEVPAFDGIGANEFIVSVTEPGLVDFISAVDTPWPWELNIWYHVLNVGYRTRISGETDFPCIYDDRVGLGRTYAHLQQLTFESWLEAIRAGRTYVSDGRSHLMSFSANGFEAGTRDVKAPDGRVRLTVDAAALLAAAPDAELDSKPADEKPYWDVERARVGTSRNVRVEFVANGAVFADRLLVADGTVQPLSVDVTLPRSGWVAARILPSSHTNPIWIEVGGQPARPSLRSARWCLKAVDQCWRQKREQIGPAEREAAQAAYDHARAVYQHLLEEGVDE
jgi:hypothetical protein